MSSGDLKVNRLILDHKFCIPHTQKGFTLIELLVSIAIIAVLATIGAVVYNQSQKTARISKRLQDLQAIQTAVETYKASTGYYPKVATGVSGTANDQCITEATGLTGANPAFVPTYMQTMPLDPTGGTNCYKYQSDTSGAEYKIWTANSVTPFVNSEMTADEYKAQPQYIDPDRDGTANDCVAQTTGSSQTAWAIYSSLGVASTNSCAF